MDGRSERTTKAPASSHGPLSAILSPLFPSLCAHSRVCSSSGERHSQKAHASFSLPSSRWRCDKREMHSRKHNTLRSPECPASKKAAGEGGAWNERRALNSRASLTPARSPAALRAPGSPGDFSEGARARVPSKQIVRSGAGTEVETSKTQEQDRRVGGGAAEEREDRGQKEAFGCVPPDHSPYRPSHLSPLHSLGRSPSSSLRFSPSDSGPLS
ncbi:hypothetical protein FA10DRAFT_270109 [Acaromyces ingoldii]|uniref:Uncharacterized protein n=1 Tax=Acaromyces ingoldii TaxID=215250 RepID=A0A316YCZ7_9BASI|nr:hypothetical protein FA10DRAFT_270109 [Acaromyces ingoldii]PWN86548.1 hypothetical protein FA10DRAFT_270109 [Acaromyces ingoldii]